MALLLRELPLLGLVLRLLPRRRMQHPPLLLPLLLVLMPPLIVLMITHDTRLASMGLLPLERPLEQPPQQLQVLLLQVDRLHPPP